MAALCLRKLIHQATRNETSCVSKYLDILLVRTMQKTTFSQTLMVMAGAKRRLMFVPTKSFCTTEEAEKKPEEKKKKTNAQKTFGSIGRKIPQRILHVISENGDSLGNMHRGDVIRLMNERDLKLVPLRENEEPPVYRLMTGKQIHEEQLKRREKQKASSKAGPVQLKELTFSATIAKHDLETKIRHIQQWIDKKHHVRISVQQRNVADGPEKMLALFDQIVETMPEKATYLSQPRVIKEGKSTCVLRHMSDKEISDYRKRETEKQTDILKKESGNETTEPSELQ
ncbi:translation initiation factor IF-3, mitochondrial [Gopherus evgoodei]|uniref:Translation initiation factor IF-3, mitochondrial n=1 Tax=Gopherus evgoodei TaxID=1825980 RepID=A0A8C4VEW2_9SAUR|nr:translation initiation factor IF-3, mitochondrial [Gopherus evgoodei]XP_030418425.1 translation initiation factor IF-3, mitochondrial [Gopherus evgoodei]XP_030418434.1 translation initiation factor IF-3, mitochondrial [Gopherus evgoodei]